MKKIWKAILAKVDVAMEHEYQGNTLVGTSYKVRTLVVLTSGPEASRQVELILPPEKALILADELRSAASEALVKEAS